MNEFMSSQNHITALAVSRLIRQGARRFAPSEQLLGALLAHLRRVKPLQEHLRHVWGEVLASGLSLAQPISIPRVSCRRVRGLHRALLAHSWLVFAVCGC